MIDVLIFNITTARCGGADGGIGKAMGKRDSLENALKQNKLAIDDNSLLEWSDWLRQMVVIIQVSSCGESIQQSQTWNIAQSRALKSIFTRYV